MYCVFFWYVVDQCFGQQCYIVGGVELFWCVKVVDGYKGGVGQFYFFGVVVYQVNESVLVVCYVVSNCNVGVVIGLNDDFFVQIFYGNLYVRFEEYY